MEFEVEIEPDDDLEEMPGDYWEVSVEPVSERDLARRRYLFSKKHPELFPEEIDYMLSPPSDVDCPF